LAIVVRKRFCDWPPHRLDDAPKVKTIMRFGSIRLVALSIAAKRWRYHQHVSKESIAYRFGFFLVAAPLGGTVGGTPSTSKFAARHSPASPLRADRFTDQELDELLGPIALYPDPLLAQVVPASTFIDQITEAYNLLGGKTDDNLIQQQNWDISVKSVAHYPQVLEMMATQTDWTTALGQAYVNQSTDVMKSVQRLRAEAKNAGALQTTPQKQVVLRKT
jgi:hypothetical protein